jgi:hypothetical protein
MRPSVVDARLRVHSTGVMPNSESTFAQEVARRTRIAERTERRARIQAERESETYTADDLRSLYRIDPETGCWMWLGETRVYHLDSGHGKAYPITRHRGAHTPVGFRCGVTHNAMSRVIFEEHLGRKLKANEDVYGTCQTNQGPVHACVNPEHHRLRHGGTLFFGAQR